MRTAAVVPAAGRGERLGAGGPKALRPIGGVPMLVHAVHALRRSPLVDLVVVAAPPADVAAVQRMLADAEADADANGPDFHGGPDRDADSHGGPASDADPDSAFRTEVRVIAGGATRQDSVRRALIALPADIDVVLVHDAARPLVPSSLVDRIVAAVADGTEAVVPGLPVTDTVKRVDSAGWVRDTPERTELRAVQTPQGFRRHVLEAVHLGVAAGVDASDDAGLVERAGISVRVIPGAVEAFKVTTPLDLLLAEAVLSRRKSEGER